MRLQKNYDPTRWQNERVHVRRAASPCFPLLFLKDERGMGQCPFIFQNVVVDRQRRQRVRRAVTERRTDFTFHSENPGALHFREIGKDVRVRCKSDNRQLWRRGAAPDSARSSSPSSTSQGRLCLTSRKDAEVPRSVRLRRAGCARRSLSGSETARKSFRPGLR